MSTTRTRRHLHTRQAILDAARAIISEEGQAALSMRALADRIDYSPAGLYEYFSSKEEIIATVCDEGHRLMYETMKQTDPDLPPAFYLYKLGKAYIQFAVEHPDYFLLMFTTSVLTDKAVLPPVTMHEAMRQPDSTYTLLMQAVERCVNAGDFATRPGFGLDEMTYAAWSLVHGAAMLRITALRQYPADLDTADDQLLANFMRGLKGNSAV